MHGKIILNSKCTQGIEYPDVLEFIKNIKVKYTFTHIFIIQMNNLDKLILDIDRKMNYDKVQKEYLDIISYFKKDFIDNFIEKNYVQNIYDDMSCILFDKIKNKDFNYGPDEYISKNKLKKLKKHSKQSQTFLESLF